MQLVAYGAQDAYLSGNPQITFWRGLYKRHTNFAMEPFRVNLTGQANWGVKHSAILPRHADLVFNTYLEVVMPPDALVNTDQGRLGYNLLKYVELDIGGQVIDRLYGEWMYLWDQLTSDYNTAKKLFRLVNADLNDGTATIPPAATCTLNRPNPAVPTVLYIPLAFFFTRSPGAALPLIALQYHEVKINILWNDIKFIAGDFTNPSTQLRNGPVQANLLIDYIYLDVEERRRMAQESHEYLIEQTQFNEDKGIATYNNRIDLTFNHPVKELVWVVQPSSYTDCGLAKAEGGTRLKPFTYDVNAVYEQGIQVNGQDRVEKKFGDYFNKVQLYQHHTGSMYTRKDVDDGSDLVQNGIYLYSFAIRPEEHQPSGTCNFSRIDTATIVINIASDAEINPDQDKTWNVRVYAVNYNVLRVMSGMAGLAYSN